MIKVTSRQTRGQTYNFPRNVIAVNVMIIIIPIVVTTYFRVVYECKPASVHKELILPIKKRFLSF